MELTEFSVSFFQNEWAFYLVYLLVLVLLFFVQKYAYMIDRKLNNLTKTTDNWEGKPWLLITAIVSGLLTYQYIILVFESISHFGKKAGIVRMIILGLIATGFYFSGLLAGLLVVTLIALGLLFYYFIFCHKRLAII